MATLWLFGDEAGVMPRADKDEVFVAATIGFLGAPPQIEFSGHRDAVIAALVATRALPCVAFVKPSPGYAQKLNARFARMNTMARATRLLTGANAKYLTPIGFSPRNMVWLSAMHQALGQTLLSAVERSLIDEIVVTLDEKTLAATTRTFFIDQVLATPEHMLPVFREALARGLPGSEHHLGRLALTRGSISIRWSDEPLDPEARVGLFLAHHLASHTFADTKRGMPPMFLADLLDAGLPCKEIDVTHILTAALADSTVREWERRTGLRAPK
ncbi:MAG: hypothetical protein V1681_02925 [Candidatus Neomarinimicrobiota bacterium]